MLQSDPIPDDLPAGRTETGSPILPADGRAGGIHCLAAPQFSARWEAVVRRAADDTGGPVSQDAPFTLVRHLNRVLKLHARMIDMQMAGLSHADSLIQPAEGGNCLNWLLGHLVDNRISMLELAGLDVPLDASLFERYKRDSDPIRVAVDALPLATILVALAATQEPLQQWLVQSRPEQHDAVVEGQTRSVLEQVAFLVWHETTHVGQLEQFRRLAGFTDKVI